MAASRVASALLAVAVLSSTRAVAQDSVSAAKDRPTQSDNATEVLKKIDQLMQQNKQLEKQNSDLVNQIEALRRILANQTAAEGEPSENLVEPATSPKTAQDSQPTEEPQATAKITSSGDEPTKWGSYTPNLGYKVANTEHGDLSVSIYSYARYLNQLGLDSTYRDAFGNVKNVQERQDFQLNKVQIKFLGWIFDPKFRYFLYAWSSNASQGLGAQVVLAGNLNYAFNKHISVGAGIRSLPGTRSVEGNFPFWLGVDTRLIADEFFRPSYTSGVWASGKIASRLDYIAMIGNNLSTLGVSAAQLNNGFDTVSTSLVWTPSTGELAWVLATSKTTKK